MGKHRAYIKVHCIWF